MARRSVARIGGRAKGSRAANAAATGANGQTSGDGSAAGCSTTTARTPAVSDDSGRRANIRTAPGGRRTVSGQRSARRIVDRHGVHEIREDAAALAGWVCHGVPAREAGGWRGDDTGTAGRNGATAAAGDAARREEGREREGREGGRLRARPHAEHGTRRAKGSTATDGDRLTTRPRCNNVWQKY